MDLLFELVKQSYVYSLLLTPPTFIVGRLVLNYWPDLYSINMLLFYSTFLYNTWLWTQNNNQYVNNLNNNEETDEEDNEDTDEEADEETDNEDSNSLSNFEEETDTVEENHHENHQENHQEQASNNELPLEEKKNQ